ncbi:hypothetical protein [Endozoicomonas arenosclerae]|uniref:hypothetical protein n=1 Tax=Endozoicomonas arenosclerae TaxID=1633495 RepID=UPI00078562B8|nr:hypothetical protein [Endozoicomonas arenosclerae]
MATDYSTTMSITISNLFMTDDYPMLMFRKPSGNPNPSKVFITDKTKMDYHDGTTYLEHFNDHGYDGRPDL